jgi:hypothetical protein
MVDRSVKTGTNVPGDFLRLASMEAQALKQNVAAAIRQAAT